MRRLAVLLVWGVAGIGVLTQTGSPLWLVLLVLIGVLLW
jgi:hypothetical protein